MKKKDWVAVIEAGYCLGQSDEFWVKNILDAATAIMNRGWWPSAFLYRYTPSSLHIDEISTKGPPFIVKAIKDSESRSQQITDTLYRSGNIIGSLSERVFARFPEEQSLVHRLTRGKIGDTIGMVATSGTGKALCLTMGFLKPATPTAVERKMWPAVASHLGSGLRLRSIAQSLTLDAPQVEAVFSPDGKLQDARQLASGADARQTLRETVRRIDRLRTREGRQDAYAAVAAWEGLVQGRWSLVDYFDSDNRRFVLAIKNDPAFPDPRGLTLRERQVAEFVGLGQSNKEISYTLGISHTAVSNCTRRAQDKLGLSCRTELATFFAPGGLRARLAEVSIQGDTLLVGSYPLLDESRISALTEAERKVLVHLLRGSTYADIAQRRQTSVHTVANQVQSIFRKLSVKSRAELASRLQYPA